MAVRYVGRAGPRLQPRHVCVWAWGEWLVSAPAPLFVLSYGLNGCVVRAARPHPVQQPDHFVLLGGLLWVRVLLNVLGQVCWPGARAGVHDLNSFSARMEAAVWLHVVQCQRAAASELAAAAHVQWVTAHLLHASAPITTSISNMQGGHQLPCLLHLPVASDCSWHPTARGTDWPWHDQLRQGQRECVPVPSWAPASVLVARQACCLVTDVQSWCVHVLVANEPYRAAPLQTCLAACPECCTWLGVVAATP